MQTTVFYVILFCIFAGLLNGSFAIPCKVMKKWNEENIWFAFSFLAFFIFPILNLYFAEPNILSVIEFVPLKAIIAVVLGGLLYGIGQICMAFAFRLIGLGLSFVITISICTAGGALIPICWNSDKLFSTYFTLQIIGILFFIIAVLFSYNAGKERDRNIDVFENPGNRSEVEKNRKILVFGVLLAIISGIGGALEGSSFAYSNAIISNVMLKHNVTPFASQIISWSILFCSAGIPYMLFFFSHTVKKASFNFFIAKGTGHYWLYILYMGACYWFSITIFCKAADMLKGDLAPTIAWPLFMIAIIGTSNFWGFAFGEWKGAGKKAGKLLAYCLTYFIIAVVIFSISSLFIKN